MNILYLHRTHSPYAERTHILGVVQGLMSFGHKLFVISPPGVNVFEARAGAAPKKKSKASYVWSLISKYSPQVLFEVFELLYNFYLYARLKKILARNKIDFIYTRYAANMFMDVYLSKKHNIPVLLEVNDSVRVYRARKPVLKKISAKIEDYVFKNCARIFTISETFKNSIASQGIQAEKIIVMPNAADTSVFDPELTDNSMRLKYNLSDKFVLGYVGAFSLWHELDKMCYILKDIKDQGFDARAFLVGDGPGRDKVIKLSRDLGIEKDIVLTGRVEYENLKHYINVMDTAVLINCGDYCSPVKIFEYMAMKKPVIAPRLKPIEEIITHKHNGILFAKDNMDELKENIIDVIKDKDYRETLGANARQTVLNKHTWDKNADKILRVYGSL